MRAASAPIPAPPRLGGSLCSATCPLTATWSPSPAPARAVLTNCFAWLTVKVGASFVIVTVANATFPDLEICAAPAAVYGERIDATSGRFATWFSIRSALRFTTAPVTVPWSTAITT